MSRASIGVVSHARRAIHNFKAERIHGYAFITQKELRAVIIEYVVFYNRKRMHSSLGYQTPTEYEVRMA